MPSQPVRLYQGDTHFVRENERERRTDRQTDRQTDRDREN